MSVPDVVAPISRQPTDAVSLLFSTALLAFLPVHAHSRDAFVAQPSASDSAWVRITTDGQTTCAFDTSYSFFYRPGASDDVLLLYFEGGGACWDWVSCSGLFDSSVSPDEVAGFRGIFDQSNPRNPLRAAGSVFIPYCTGDVHIGDATRQYGDSTTRPVAHRGFRNVQAVLRWIGEQAFRPRLVVVAGTSAGSYGALFHLPSVEHTFPDARVLLLADSGVPLLSDNVRVLRTWGADSVLSRQWGESVGARPLLQAWRQVASSGRRVRVAVMTTDRDAIQSGFYLVSGSPEWRTSTYRLLADAHAAAPNLSTFIAHGSDHGLLPTDRFYGYEEQGMSLVEWVRRLMAWEAVPDVRCGECAP